MKTIYKGFIAIFCLIAITTNLRSQTIISDTIYIQKDAIVSLVEAETNFGDYEFFESYIYNGKISERRRSFIQFDLSGIPAEAQIISAMLHLFGTGHTGKNESYLQMVKSPWEEYTVTYKTQPALLEDYVILEQSDNPNQNYQVEINHFFDMWINQGVANNGLALRIANVDLNLENGLKFGSSDHSNEENHPYIVIQYELPITIPTTKIQDRFFGKSGITFDMKLFADEIEEAETYEFLVEKVDSGTYDTIIKPVNYFSLNELDNPEYSTEYLIKVKAISGFVSGDFGIATPIYSSHNSEVFNEIDHIAGEIFIKLNDSENFNLKFNKDSSDLYNEETDNIFTFINDFGVNEISHTYIHYERFPKERLNRIYTVKLDSIAFTDSLVSLFDEYSIIEYAEKVPKHHFYDIPSDLQSEQWELGIIDAQAAWNITTGSNEVVIVVMDDAIKISHEDLWMNIWVNIGEVPLEIIANVNLDDDNIVTTSEIIDYMWSEYPIGFDFNNDGESNITDVLHNLSPFMDGIDGYDNNGYIDDLFGWDSSEGDNNPNPNPAIVNDFVFTHGTHVAGIASAVTNNDEIGIASIGHNVRILPIKINNDNEEFFDVPQGFNYLTTITSNTEIPQHRYVVNMSWGGEDAETYLTYFDALYNDDEVILVAAAGNEGLHIDRYPACDTYVIGVGSTNKEDGVSVFSNYHEYLDVMAPGGGLSGGILSTLAGTNSSYGELSGTSMASPLVAGICALILSYDDTKTPLEVGNCLKEGCNDELPWYTDLMYEDRVGAGRVNAFEALACIVDNTDPLANFDYELSNTDCFVVTFVNSSLNETEWLWEFPDGTSLYTEDCSFNFGDFGDYEVTLTVGNGTTEHSITQTISVNPPGAEIIAHSINEVCIDQPAYVYVELTGTAPWNLTYFINDDPNPVVVNESPYLIQLIPGDVGGAGSELSITLTAISDAVCTNPIPINVEEVFYVDDCESCSGEFDNWYFGDNAGVNFNNGFAVAQTGSSIPTEGPASISDSDGNTLFYFDGHHIYDNDNNIVPGPSFTLSSAETQMSLIVPKPNHLNEYYLYVLSSGVLFVTNVYTSPVSYDPLVGVLSPSPFCDKQNACYHANGEDIWVVEHLHDGSTDQTFYKYKLTEFNTPGSAFDHEQDIGSFTADGSIKFSRDGSKMACATNYSLDVYNFDRESGDLSNPIHLLLGPGQFAYGIEFSPDNSKLYVQNNNSIWGGLYQFDLEAGDATAINFSKTIITNIYAWGLQLGPDGRIYRGTVGEYLDVINNPNELYPDCDFIINGLFLGNNGSCLPNSVLYSNGCGFNVNSNFNHICNGASGSIEVEVTGGVIPYSYSWSNGGTTQNINVTIAGTYIVTITDDNGNTATDSFTIEESTLSLSSTQIGACFGEDCSGSIDLSVDGTAPPYAYNWNDEFFIEDLNYLCAGDYSVTVTDNIGCEEYITVPITESNITLTFSTTNSSCPHEPDGSITVTPSGGIPDYFYVWSNSVTTAENENIAHATYIVTVTDANGCTTTGSGIVGLDNYEPEIFLEIIDDCYAFGDAFPIDNTSTPSGCEHFWDFGNDITNSEETPSVFPFSTHGTFNVTYTISNECGSQTESFLLNVEPDVCVCDVIYDIPDGYVVDGTTSETWANETVEGVIWIQTSLIIDGTIQFAPRGKLIVEEGAELILNDFSVLTSLVGCDYMWQGIEVWGNTNIVSTSTVHGSVIYNKNITIENAHIGILAGRRNDPEYFDVTSSDKFDYSKSGGVIYPNSVYGGFINFVNCGAGIKFITKNQSDAIVTKIENCNFTCTQLIDQYYLSTDPHKYPNSGNPFAVGSNLNQWTVVGIDVWGVNDLSIKGNHFNQTEFGIKSKDARFNITSSDTRNSSFINHKFGIYISNSLPTVLYNHNITGCYFDNIHDIGFPFIKSAAIFINNGRFDRIVGNTFSDQDDPLINQENNFTAIRTVNTSKFNITDNSFNKWVNGIVTFNSNSGGGIIGFESQGNIFTYCKNSIISDDSNIRLKSKCFKCYNDPINVIPYEVNWDNYGLLANQGSPLPWPINPWGEPHVYSDRYPAGHELFPPEKKQFKSWNDNEFEYFRHNDPVNSDANSPLVPDVSESPEIILINNTGVDKLSHSCEPISNGMPRSEMVSLLNDLIQYENNLKVAYGNIESNLDHNKTQILLDALAGSVSPGKLKNLLIDNSPLSDQVLISVIENSNKFSPGNFKNVMVPNLPANIEVYNELRQVIESFPDGIKNQLIEKHIHDDQGNTMASINREIQKTETMIDELENKLISLSIDEGNFDEAVDMTISLVASDYDRQQAFSTYMETLDYSIATDYLNSITEDETLTDWKDIAAIILESKLNGEQIIELTEEQKSSLYLLADQYPVTPAASTAQGILFQLYDYVPEFYMPIGVSSKSASLHPSGIDKDKTVNFYLGKNYPDPFTKSTVIPYIIPEESEGKIIIYNLAGSFSKVFVLISANKELQVETDDWQSGIYIYMLKVNGEVIGRNKMVLINQ